MTMMTATNEAAGNCIYDEKRFHKTNPTTTRIEETAPRALVSHDDKWMESSRGKMNAVVTERIKEETELCNNSCRRGGCDKLRFASDSSRLSWSRFVRGSRRSRKTNHSDDRKKKQQQQQPHTGVLNSIIYLGRFLDEKDDVTISSVSDISVPSNFGDTEEYDMNAIFETCPPVTDFVNSSWTIRLLESAQGEVLRDTLWFHVFENGCRNEFLELEGDEMLSFVQLVLDWDDKASFYVQMGGQTVWFSSDHILERLRFLLTFHRVIPSKVSIQKEEATLECHRATSSAAWLMKAYANRCYQIEI